MSENKNNLNASEAVYGFVAWLTCRVQKTVMSANDNAAPMVELVTQFCIVNKLPEVSKNWPANLIHPDGEITVPSQYTQENDRKFNLLITPAVPPEIRHKIEDVLKVNNYRVIGGGQMVDGISSDISFEQNKEED